MPDRARENANRDDDTAAGARRSRGRVRHAERIDDGVPPGDRVHTGSVSPLNGGRATHPWLMRNTADTIRCRTPFPTPFPTPYPTPCPTRCPTRRSGEPSFDV